MPNQTSVKNFLEEILSRMGIVFESVDEEDDGIGIVRLNIVSEKDSRVLIGPQGEHLQALNSVFKRIVEADEESSYIVDVNNYQKKRIDELRDMTKIIAARAKHFGKNTPLPTMSPYERMIVHAAAQTIDGIKTRSEGMGKERYVVIIPS